ncbi:hypothetical protein [Bacillus taeanensis]|uniref:Uncharacterized protein n=1 Tax=Bacillus taeanensis TaxID=273032 RepID=A0A366Y251_9BACI|nr:hypothetical protein [Bacillus taeanensis]RBW70474.1 hypothetical protein DS031_05455 [Bacillus taeanensis]
MTSSIYKKDLDEAFEPREYYRSGISKEQVGIALTDREDKAQQILQKFQQHPKIRDIIMLSYSGEMLIAIKPAAYYQKNFDEVKQGISQQLESEGIAATLVTTPAQFRKIKKLKNKKYSVNIKEWELEWNKVLDEI